MLTDQRLRLAETCKKPLAELQRSPTFAMSLGAKELFHTNFLAFLLESDGQSLDRLRRALRTALNFPVTDGELSTCVVWREKKHMDLILVPLVLGSGDEGSVLSSKRAHVIEAKLKSIPTAFQLKRYDSDLSKGFDLVVEDDTNKEAIWLGPPKRSKRPVEVVTRTLLSASRLQVLDGWLPATWQAVAAAVEANLPVADVDAGLRFVLADYGNSLNHIAVIVQAATERAQEMIARNCSYADFLGETRAQAFVDLRVKDLISKVMYDCWLRELEPKIVEGAREAYVVYTNSNPGLGVDFETPESASGPTLRVGVQIQDTEFRHYVAAVEETNRLESLVLREPLWTQWLNVDVSLGTLEGKKVTLKDPAGLRAFNKNRFIFKRSRITSEHKMADVSDALVGSLVRAEQLASSAALKKLLASAD